MDFRRIDRGRAHSYTLDGQPLPGVTSIIDALGKPGLVTWSANITAEYAVNNWAELSGVPVTQRLATLKGARWGVSDPAALNGTRVHALAEQLVTGAEVDVPPQYLGAASAVARFMDAWAIEPVMHERPVLHPGHGWAGTIDLLCGIRGTLWLLDWKTGKKVYPETALQLAAYAHAAYAQTEAGALVEWTVPERAGAVHITSDSAELLPIDWAVTEEAYTVFRYLQQVAKWSERVSAAQNDASPWPVGAALDPSAVVSVP